MEVPLTFTQFTKDWPTMDETIREFRFQVDLLAEKSWIGAAVRVLILASIVFFQYIPLYAFALSVFVVVLVYYYIFRPADYFRDLSSFDYGKVSGKFGKSTRQGLIHTPRNESRMEDVPPIHPNGWFAIMESSDIHKNQVKYVAALGENFAIFRKSNGKIHVVDAYCPHLGANMGIGGVVKNDCLECPFHGWQFDGETGKCTSIPYAEKVPEFAKVRTWRCCEVNHFIFVWYHAEGDEPTYEPQPIKEIMDGDHRYIGRSEHLFNSHFEDWLENGADAKHFNQLHSPLTLTGSDLRTYRTGLLSFIKLNYEVTWKPNSDVPHEALLHAAIDVHLFGKPMFLIGDIAGKYIGPALMELNASTPFGTFKIINSITPVKPLVQRVVHRVYGPPLATFIGRYYLSIQTVTIDRDIMIWNNKKYEANPKLVKEDGPILEYRRWFSKFYSKNSPRLKLQDDSLDW